MDNQSIPAEELTARASRIAWSLTARYNGSLEFDDLHQQMWLAYCEQANNPNFINQTVTFQLNHMAWRARDWARHELAKMNHIADVETRSPYHLADVEAETDFDGDGEWEYLALPVDIDDDPLADMIAQETGRDLVQIITQALAVLEVHNPRTVTVAQELMAGKKKGQIARDLGIGQSAVSWHLQLLRTAFTEVLSQA